MGALLGASAIAAGPVAAKTPGWQIINEALLPATVGDGQVAGVSFTIVNSGSSNISALYLTDSVAASPEYLATDRGTSMCQTTPDLRCSFGALNAGASIRVTIAYRVGTSDFVNTYKLDSTGDPSGTNNSHGDSYFKTLTTSVSSSSDFDGSFTVPGTSLNTNATLGRNNKQATSLVPPESLIPATIEDHITSGVACTVAKCSNAFGEWSILHVNGGASYFPTPFKATLFIWGGAVPGSVKAGDIVVLHTSDAGVTSVISTPCSPTTGTPTNAECLTVTKVGTNFQVDVWLFQNGGIRGTF